MKNSIDASLFRSIMRNLANCVAVITTSQSGQPHGMTGTAISSVSTDPVTMLTVINRSTRSHGLISKSKIFAVNILSAPQKALGERFASGLDDQFAGLEWFAGKSGSPILVGVTAYLDCMTVTETHVGTHTIFIGRVVAGGSSTADPLLYHDGNYKALAG